MDESPKRARLRMLKKPDKVPVPQVVATLEELLEHAKSGELVSISVIAFYADGTLDPELAVSGNYDSLLMHGAIFRLQRFVEELDEGLD